MKKLLSLILISVFLFTCQAPDPKHVEDLSKIDYDKAYDLFADSQYDSAFYYYNKVISAPTDSLLMGKSLFNMAIIQSIQGDYFGSDESAVKSLNYFDENNPSYLATVYNTIAINKTDLKDYQEAITWYKKAIAIDHKDDDLDSLMFQNNLAVAHYKIKNYDTAKAIYKRLVVDDTVKNSPTLLSKVIDNLAYTKWLQEPSYQAAPELLIALKIREQQKDLWGQNASFSHFTDYYSKSRPDSALIYANKMYEVAKTLKSANDQLTALKFLIKLGPSKSAKANFEVYQQLDDSLQTARSRAKNQFAIIRYETERHKAKNLQLQNENTEKRNLLLALTLVAMTLVIGSVFWFKKRKRKLEADAQHAIRDSKLKTSKRVHDVVANGLYRVMTEMENLGSINKDHMIDQIEALYEKSRDISYENEEEATTAFQDQVSALLSSFATEDTKILIAGNATEMWEKLSANVQYEVNHILQELLVNMKKHSQATNVAVRFEEKDRQIYIYYIDNGVGMKENARFNNGLRNTGNRIDTLKGAITFDTKAEKGLKIWISFPIS